MSENTTIEISTETTPVRRAVPHIVEAIRTEPWAITREALETICAIASRENDFSIEALEAIQAKRVQGTFGLQVRDGVAIISARGPLMRYADLFSMISGATSYEAIRRDLETAMRDPQVRAVLLSIDSPGGSTNGCAELANAIVAAGAVKPVEAYVGGTAASAAYWIATACNRITIDATAVLGSIGVLMSIRDSSEREARSGVKTIEFASSRAPNKRLSYDSDEGKAKILRVIDAMEGVFIQAVATNRGVSEETVAVNFGAGGLEVGAEAVRIGMADALGSFEEVFARLRNGNGQKARSKGTTPMSDTKTYSQAEFDAAVAKAAQDATTSAQTQASTEAQAAAKASQDRIRAIQTAPEAAKRPKLAAHLAFNTGMSSDDAIGMLKEAAEEPTAAGPAGSTRAKDAAGGLAIDTLAEGSKPQEKQEEKKPAVIDTSAIYKRLNETTASR